MHQTHDAATAIQIFYPMIYMACHTEHVRARSSTVHLSARDSSILAHLAHGKFASATKLARHLNVAPSTVSEAVHGLVDLGYVRVRGDENDERRNELVLTERGLQAMKGSSVLDAEKLAAVLERMRPEDRAKAVEGFRLLAEAAGSAASGS
jgi:DNA-binding MarR family transcriptional regulator